MILVVTNDRPSANSIQPRFGQTKAAGRSNPSRTNSDPSGSIIWEALENFPRYNHQPLNSTKTLPTIKPNSRSRRKDFFLMLWNSAGFGESMESIGDLKHTASTRGETSMLRIRAFWLPCPQRQTWTKLLQRKAAVAQ
jgi:hypothetical protein